MPCITLKGDHPRSGQLQRALPSCRSTPIRPEKCFEPYERLHTLLNCSTRIRATYSRVAKQYGNFYHTMKSRRLQHLPRVITTPNPVEPKIYHSTATRASPGLTHRPGQGYPKRRRRWGAHVAPGAICRAPIHGPLFARVVLAPNHEPLNRGALQTQAARGTTRGAFGLQSREIPSTVGQMMRLSCCTLPCHRASVGRDFLRVCLLRQLITG